MAEANVIPIDRQECRRQAEALRERWAAMEVKCLREAIDPLAAGGDLDLEALRGALICRYQAMRVSRWLMASPPRYDEEVARGLAELKAPPDAAQAEWVAKVLERVRHPKVSGTYSNTFAVNSKGFDGDAFADFAKQLERIGRDGVVPLKPGEDVRVIGSASHPEDGFVYHDERAPAGKSRCRDCGVPVPIGDALCDACGLAQEKAPPYPKVNPPVSQVVGKLANGCVRGKAKAEILVGGTGVYEFNRDIRDDLGWDVGRDIRLCNGCGLVFPDCAPHSCRLRGPRQAGSRVDSPIPVGVAPCAKIGDHVAVTAPLGERIPAGIVVGIDHGSPDSDRTGVVMSGCSVMVRI